MRPEEVGLADDTVIRSASGDDVEALCGLYDAFHEFHVRGVPDRLASLRGADPAERTKLRRRIGEVVAAADSAILVAERGGRLIGLAEVYVRGDEDVPARVPRRYAHLQSMVVEEKHRRGGVGRTLLRAAEDWARERGAAEMRLDVWEFSDGPLAFYERVGYRTLRRTLVRDLD
jgi:GNAT superfamily N-acetyltransferase